jgi:plastocyanin
MEKKRTDSSAVTRRSFIKLVGTTLGISLGAPLLNACTTNNNNEEYQVNIVIQQSQIHYAPATLTIPHGATVTWLNQSYYSQSVTCDPKQAGDGNAVNLPQGAQAWDSGMLYPGQRFSKTFDTPGTYVYFSLPRLSPNALGTIIVKE